MGIKAGGGANPWIVLGAMAAPWAAWQYGLLLGWYWASMLAKANLLWLPLSSMEGDERSKA